MGASRGDSTLPRLRVIEVVAVRQEGHRVFLLRDPQGFAAEPLVLPAAAASLLGFFDGRHSIRDAQTAIARRTGQIVPAEQIRGLGDKLDAGHYLESEAFREHRRMLADTYARLPHRPARFAGQAYSADAEELLGQLSATYTAPGGPGLPAASVAATPLGLAAPHIDPPRGGTTYAYAYARTWGARPRRVVVLGICHGSAREPFVLTTKDYATPLGIAPTDRELVKHLVARLDWDPLAEEDLHQWEHSIEFQVIYLQHALSCGGQAALPEALTFLPVLCSFPWEIHAGDAETPEIRDQLAEFRAKVEDFLAALAELLRAGDEPPLLVAGIDLAHVGRRFGNADGISEAQLTSLSRRDMRTLSLVAGREREAFVAETVREENERSICGYPALYSLLTLLPADAGGAVLDYGQSVENATGSAVSFAALVFGRPPTA